MKKFFVLLVFICCFVSSNFAIAQLATEHNVPRPCVSGFKKKTKKNYPKDYYYCHNTKTQVAYNKNGLFYYKDTDFFCAKDCDLNAQNCKEGYCEKINCKDGYKLKKNPIQYPSDTSYKVYTCANPINNLYYDKFDNFYYANNKKCGKSCDINGNNCKQGHCNQNICAKGYYKKGDFCYSSTSKLSYRWKNDYKEFYLNGHRCGESCDLDGKNCKIGICNSSRCAKGYVLKADPAISNYEGVCYNQTNKISYYNSHEGNLTIFNRDGGYCGRNCDYSGRNCKEGFCGTLTCPAGFQLRKYNECYNPKTNISYDDKLRFFNGKHYCGDKCKLDGTGCSVGGCNKDSCAKGFVIDGKYCTNPTTKLSYMKTDYEKNKTFYTSPLPHYYCGENCDLDGRNCKVGFCNTKDCAPGYQQKGVYCLNTALSLAYDREKNIIFI